MLVPCVIVSGRLVRGSEITSLGPRVDRPSAGPARPTAGLCSPLGRAPSWPDSAVFQAGGIQCSGCCFHDAGGGGGDR